MDIVNIHEAKTQLSRLLERVVAGEEIIIARHGKPIAKLVPFTAEPRQLDVSKASCGSPLSLMRPYPRPSPRHFVESRRENLARYARLSLMAQRRSHPVP